VRDEGVELVGGVLVLVPQPGQADAHPDQHTVMDPGQHRSETQGREHQLREQVREGRTLRQTDVSSTRLRGGLDTTLQVTSKIR
jgi:hypothetical protein